MTHPQPLPDRGHEANATAAASLPTAMVRETTWFLQYGEPYQRARIPTHPSNPAAAVSSCNSVSQDVEERPIDDDLVGRNSWRGTFFLFPLVCDMGLFFSLSLSLFILQRHAAGIRQRATNSSRRHTIQTINTWSGKPFTRN